MREFFKYGSVGRVGGNPGSYPEAVSEGKDAETPAAADVRRYVKYDRPI
jgi:hypothetical protein